MGVTWRGWIWNEAGCFFFFTLSPSRKKASVSSKTLLEVMGCESWKDRARLLRPSPSAAATVSCGPPPIHPLSSSAPPQLPGAAARRRSSMQLDHIPSRNISSFHKKEEKKIVVSIKEFVDITSFCFFFLCYIIQCMCSTVNAFL